MRRILTALLMILCSTRLPAQAGDPSERPWVFATRLVLTGSSDESDPPGFQVYSAFSLEAGLRRNFSEILAAELTIRTESREVDSLVTAGENRRLGSLELLPLNLLLQFRPRLGRNVHPYAGAGVNVTVAWEKSGVLDSVDMKGSVGPALELGTDVDLSASALLNFDLRWNSFEAKLESGGSPLANLKIDPLSLGVGVGFRF